jgi:hypothetical protein
MNRRIPSNLGGKAMLLLAHLFGFFAAPFLLLAGAAWLRIARSSRDPVPASALRPAGWLTGIAFVLLAIALLIAAGDWAGKRRLENWSSAETDGRVLR